MHVSRIERTGMEDVESLVSQKATLPLSHECKTAGNYCESTSGS